MAEDGNVSTSDGDIEPMASAEPTEPATSEAETASPDAAAPELGGTWILNTGDGQISMVIYQSEDLLFGAANSETPKPWNGVVSGLVYGNELELQILSLQDGVLVSMLIAGTAAEGSITGTLVQSDSQGKVNKESVMGFLTSPDTSGYEPVDVPTAAMTAATVTPTPEIAATTEEETNEDGRKKPVDVVTLKDTIPYSPFEI
ncbi:hypothetical protein [Methanocrinis sp.]|uniref:hypothetical protein n=1 Tax=Methanocrinis sp. TaxID=3101522 RepID=UPI003D0AF918